MKNSQKSNNIWVTKLKVNKKIKKDVWKVAFYLVEGK